MINTWIVNLESIAQYNVVLKNEENMDLCGRVFYNNWTFVYAWAEILPFSGEKIMLIRLNLHNPKFRRHHIRNSRYTSSWHCVTSYVSSYYISDQSLCFFLVKMCNFLLITPKSSQKLILPKNLSKNPTYTQQNPYKCWSVIMLNPVKTT